MGLLESRVDRKSASFARNVEDHLAMIDQLRSLEAKVQAASNRSRAKFEARGQLVPRDRIALLLDRGSPFLELSTLAGYRMHDDDGDANIAGGGNITGIGFVAGVRVVVSASDAGIRGGAATPLGMEKALRAQDIAIENKLPYVQLIESAGANLFRQADMFVRGGRSFANLARMSALGLPVVAVVHGSSTAGGAYQTGLSDYVVLVRNRSRIFLAGPPLLRAATGEIADEEDLGGAEMHYAVAGTGEYLAENDADGLRIARDVISRLGWNDDAPARVAVVPKPPIHSADDLLGIVPVDYRQPYDAREVVARLVDGSDFLEFKAGFGPHTVTGHAAIGGHQIGILANNGPIDANGAAKAAQFIQICCQSDRPLLFLQNTTGFMVGLDAERGGIVKHGSKMIQAVTNATVPRLTVNIGASFGAGNYGMCGRGFDPRFLFAWPNHRISVMGGEQAAGTMAIVAEDAARKRGVEPDRAALDVMRSKVVEAYRAEGEALYATARLWDDGLIDPRDTRQLLIFCLDTCREAEARRPRASSFGVARM
jgi:geranyl-CoA carboxylase beta subunit